MNLYFTNAYYDGGEEDCTLLVVANTPQEADRLFREFPKRDDCQDCVDVVLVGVSQETGEPRVLLWRDMKTVTFNGKGKIIWTNEASLGIEGK